MPTVIRPSINGMSHQSVRPARRERRRCDHSSPRALSSACSSRNSRYVMSKEDVSIPVADAAESRTHFGSAIQSRTTLMNVSRWFTVGRTTEGIYDTASLRSQKASQHKTVYQEEATLPKRRCPRRCKPARDNGANEHDKPNDAPGTKPWSCVKTMLSGGLRVDVNYAIVRVGTVRIERDAKS